MGVRILGIGSAVPEHALAQDDAARFVGRVQGLDATQERVLTSLYRRATVEKRGISLLEPERGEHELSWFYAAGDDEKALGPDTAARMREYAKRAPVLAAEACRRALEDAGVDENSVTHLVVATCTGFRSPGVAVTLIDALGLPRGVTRTEIGFMGCHAALNALQVATAFASSDPGARVLVVCVELCSLHLQYDARPRGQVVNALFGDAAAAMVVGQGAGAAVPWWRVVDTASHLIDDSRAEMSWEIGNHGFVMELSPRVPGLVAEHLRPWLDTWLAAHGLHVGDVASWAIHAGGPRIVDATSKCLGLRAEHVRHARDVLQAHGNVSSPTIMMILERVRAAGDPGPCVALAFGPGLVVEAMLLDQ